MDDIEISEAALRRFNLAMTLIVTGTVVGVAIWFDRTHRRWWEENRPITPGYLPRWWGGIVQRSRDRRQALRDARDLFRR
jgi:hypothetical protein